MSLANRRQGTDGNEHAELFARLGLRLTGVLPDRTPYAVFDPNDFLTDEELTEKPPRKSGTVTCLRLSSSSD